MKTNKLIGAFIVLIMMIPVLAITSCSEDAPSYSHSSSDLIGGDNGNTWTWTTTEGDLPEAFEVTIDVISDDKFAINDFANVGGDRIEVQITDIQASSAKLAFSGDVTGGVVEGTGSIINGWATMNISFVIDYGEEKVSCEATLEHTKMISKKRMVALKN